MSNLPNIDYSAASPENGFQPKTTSFTTSKGNEIPPFSRNDGTKARLRGEEAGGKAANLFSSSIEPASHSERSEETQKEIYPVRLILPDE